MPYINAELQKRKRLDIKNYEHDVEINKQEDVTARLTYSSDLTLQEVTTGPKLVASLPNMLPNVGSTDELMAIEGQCRKEYYQSFNVIIEDPTFRFQIRERRPPKHHLDALISFGNSLLYVTVLAEIYKTHLDPRIGFLHSTNFRKFSLNLDVAEIFKPIIVDRVIFTLANKKMLDPKHFIKEMNGIYLNDRGRAEFLKEYDRKLLQTIGVKGRKFCYKRLIRIELYKIEKHLLGECEYSPFSAQW